MKKNSKLVAVLSASAFLAIGASMTAFGAEGWVDENGIWVYNNDKKDRYCCNCSGDLRLNVCPGFGCNY